MVQYELKYENKNEVKVLTEKLKILREEFKYSKDLFKSTEAKIKSQNLYILNTEVKCQKIKENIEFKKRNKETPATTITEQKEYFDSENPLINIVSGYEEQMKFSEIQINAEEKNYKSEITRQQAQISKMGEEINFLTFQLKEKEQDIRINDLKLKELNKISKHQQEQQKQQGLLDNENSDLPQNLRMQVNYNSVNYRHQRNPKNNANRPNSANLKQIPGPVLSKQHHKQSGSKTPATTLGRINKPFSKNDIKFDLRSKNNSNDNYGYGINSNQIPMNRNANYKNIKFNYKQNYEIVSDANVNINNNTNSTGNGNPRRIFNKDILNNNYDANVQKNILLMQRDDMLNEIQFLSNCLLFKIFNLQ
jgi:hypothetical protein